MLARKQRWRGALHGPGRHTKCLIDESWFEFDAVRKSWDVESGTNRLCRHQPVERLHDCVCNSVRTTRLRLQILSPGRMRVSSSSPTSCHGTNHQPDVKSEPAKRNQPHPPGCTAIIFTDGRIERVFYLVFPPIRTQPMFSPGGERIGKQVSRICENPAATLVYDDFTSRPGI